jgi:hypothetical protein
MRQASVLFMILGSLSLSGCINRLFGGGGEPTVEGENGSIALSKLQRVILNLADRDVVLIADACEAIKLEAETADVRRQAQQFKLANGTAVYDIVSSPNILGHLIDLYVLIHLQHLVLMGEGKAARSYGEKGAGHLAHALDQARGEIDQLVEICVKNKQRAQLDALIQVWRRSNPGVEEVSGIRLGDLPSLAGKSILSIIPSFFDVLNPLDETSRSVDETRQLAERAFYFSKRMPTLLEWQTDSALESALVKPELHQVLNDVSATRHSVDHVSGLIEHLPDFVASERKEILAAWDARQEEASSTVRDIRSALAEGKEFAVEVRGAGKALEETLEALQRVVEAGGDSRGPAKSKLFDIAEASAAAVEISKMAREAHALVNDGHALLASPAWTKREEAWSRLARDATADAERAGVNVVDHLAWRLLQVLGAVFVLSILRRILLKEIERSRWSRSGAGRGPEAGRPNRLSSAAAERAAARSSGRAFQGFPGSLE